MKQNKVFILNLLLFMLQGFVGCAAVASQGWEYSPAKVLNSWMKDPLQQLPEGQVVLTYIGEEKVFKRHEESIYYETENTFCHLATNYEVWLSEDKGGGNIVIKPGDEFVISQIRALVPPVFEEVNLSASGGGSRLARRYTFELDDFVAVHSEFQLVALNSNELIANFLCYDKTPLQQGEVTVSLRAYQEPNIDSHVMPLPEDPNAYLYKSGWYKSSRYLFNGDEKTTYTYQRGDTTLGDFKNTVGKDFSIKLLKNKIEQ